MRECSRCHRQLSLDQFHKDSRRKDRLRTHCRDCNNAWAKASYHKDLAKSRARTSAQGRKARTGWLEEEVVLALQEQDNRCKTPSCRQILVRGSMGRTRMCADHNHLTGQKRGLLCSRCNLAIGQAQDNPQILRELADYLESYANRHDC